MNLYGNKAFLAIATVLLFNTAYGAAMTSDTRKVAGHYKGPNAQWVQTQYSNLNFPPVDQKSSSMILNNHLYNPSAFENMSDENSSSPLSNSENNAGGQIKLEYFGGPIISQVKVMTVFWNKDVRAEIQNEIPKFYSEFVNSQHIDWLSEYNTNLTAINGRAGTNQKFSRGQTIGTAVLNPSFASSELNDDQIVAELIYQIQNKNLPTPDSNTLYAIHFPGYITINSYGEKSCVAFGGYHNGVHNNQLGDIFYTVIPDCGFNSLDANASFNYTTIVSSHEVIEAITDAFPTPGDKPAYPQAWNTIDGYEIADICSYGKAVLVGSKRSYAISSEWSNKRGRCYDGATE